SVAQRERLRAHVGHERLADAVRGVVAGKTPLGPDSRKKCVSGLAVVQRPPPGLGRADSRKLKRYSSFARQHPQPVSPKERCYSTAIEGAGERLCARVAHIFGPVLHICSDGPRAGGECDAATLHPVCRTSATIGPRGPSASA